MIDGSNGYSCSLKRSFSALTTENYGPSPAPVAGLREGRVPARNRTSPPLESESRELDETNNFW